MAAAFEHVFVSKEGSDVTFIVHNNELKAHQFILINRSPVFKAMIKGPMAPANQQHEITDPDIEFDDFNNFLKFLYTEKCEVTIENFQALLHFSDMYDVSSLSEFCVNTLSKTLSKQNLLKFAEFGIIYENKFGIVTKCLHELSNKNVQTLQFQEENKMVWISSDLVIDFIKRCPRTPSFTETDVFRKVCVLFYFVSKN
uniref:BTB domain-containing protein n=1 Tax=Panagrolaimus davidi TaxID=227884 RepID=A0A914PQI5_9BILA